MKRCSRCKEEKPPEEFLTSRKMVWCKECNRASARAWYAANPARAMLASARKRAAKAGLPFDLVLTDIVVPETCPALGIPLIAAANGNGPTPNSPSIDRIKPELGYVKGNIIVVSLLANQIKTSATPAQIIQVGEFYSQLMQA